MNDKATIKRLRTQSLLKVVLAEALASLDDNELSCLMINDVDCRKGRYDAFIYLDKMAFTQQEQEKILAKLKKVSKILQAHCLRPLGMFRCPNFHFRFDESLEKINKIESLFAKIEQERKNNANK